MYDLHVRIPRKYSKTQLLALGVRPDYVDCMMGRTIGAYHDKEMKGIEFLRNVYAGVGLGIRPKPK